MAYDLFLFAHQDDEYGVFEQIRQSVFSKRCTCCIYLTNGGSNSERRNSESLKVLAGLGVERANIHFWGSEFNVPDGRLYQHYARARRWLADWLESSPDVHAIYIPAWEGGHPDHDTLHVLAVRQAIRLGVTERTWQYSLYNRSGCLGPFYRVLFPLPQNGNIVKQKITIPHRFLFLRSCLRYSSQWKTWLGLFPFVLLHYLLKGTQELQPISLERIKERPHAGKLYYEYRKFSFWGDLCAALTEDDVNTL